MLPARLKDRKTLTARNIALTYAVLGVLWIVLSDRVLGFIIDDPEMQMKLGTAKGYVFVAITAGLLYLLLFERRVGTGTESHDREVRGGLQLKQYPLLAFIGLAMIVPLISYGIVQIYGPRLQESTFSDLRAISELKAGRIEAWLDERHHDADFIASNDRLIASIDAWVRQGNLAAGSDVESRFELIERTYGYRLDLLDADGRLVRASRLYLDNDETITSFAASALESRQMQHRDLYRDGEGKIHLDIYVPLIRDPAGEAPVAIGVIIVHTPVEQFLFPLIQTWPASSPSAETVLTRREGDDVLFLNELRHRSGTALSYRYPLGNVTLPAAVSILANEPRVIHGIDYRGVPVLAAVRPVQGTPWHLVTKIDRNEVMEPLKQVILWFSIVTIFMISCITPAIVMLWHRQGHSHELAMQDQAAERDRLLRRFYDMPFIGMAIIDPATRRPTHVNDQLCTMLGRTRETLLATNWVEMIHGEARTTESACLDQVLANRSEGYQHEIRVMRNGGEIIDATVNVQGVRRRNGSVEFLIAIMQDITERKRSEQALKEREADLNRAQAVARVGSWSLDVRADRMEWSAECHRLFGVSPGTPLNYQTFFRCVHPDDVAYVEHEWRKAEQGGSYDIEHRIIVNGEIRWIRERADLHRDDSGQLVSVIGTSLDITDSKKDQERLRQAATVFESTREGIMVTDAKRRITMVNRAFCEMSGYSEDELLGQTPSLLRSGRNKRSFYASMWHAIRLTGYWQGEIWDRRKDGELFPVLLSINALRDTGGQLTGYVGVFTDISRLKDSEARLEFLAHHDSLTGLPNRLLMLSRLKHSLEVGRREQSRLALLMLDLDRFKDVNDSYGHVAGDEILRQVAQRLTSRLRGIDTVARLGGDEFALLLANLAHPVDAERVAREIIIALSEPCRLSNGAEVRIGTSVGVSLYPDHGQSPEALLQHADAALYRAKADGRSCIRYFSDELTAAARTRIELDARLRRAIVQQELRVFYQPQLDIGSNRIIGAEALIRWKHPERGLIPPAEFVPAAEETGLISEIGAWVLREACRQGSAWLADGLPPLTLAVNLSPHQFLHGDIGTLVAEVLAQTGFPPERLELELTESVLMSREDIAVEVLQSLRSLGVRLAIDDFGTGYSSLAYLKRFPLDVLKIYKGFIKDIPHDADDAEITLAIIAMAHALGFKVLAEGVETPEQLAFLRKHGCDLYQGFIASDALPARAFTALFAGCRQTRTG
jgi:diguanylate cyclase (GGDEF)-like protein/PAS domain S-box-containing protein